MLKIDNIPNIQTIKFSSNSEIMSSQENNVVKENSVKENKDKKILCTLLGLATLGIVAAGIKTSPKNYEEILKKSGIEIKNGVATLIGTNERYTGKVERFVTHNRKETIEFVNGNITEKVYHNAFGKELEGYFYKDGVVQLSVGKHLGKKSKSFPFYEYKEEKITIKGDILNQKIDSVFGWAREMVKNIK